MKLNIIGVIFIYKLDLCVLFKRQLICLHVHLKKTRINIALMVLILQLLLATLICLEILI